MKRRAFLWGRGGPATSRRRVFRPAPGRYMAGGPSTILVPFDSAESPTARRAALPITHGRNISPAHDGRRSRGAGGMIGTRGFLQQAADGKAVMLTPATPVTPVNIPRLQFTLHARQFQPSCNAQMDRLHDFVVRKTALAQCDGTDRRDRAIPADHLTSGRFRIVGSHHDHGLAGRSGLSPNAVRVVQPSTGRAMAHLRWPRDKVASTSSGGRRRRDPRLFIPALAVFRDHRRGTDYSTTRRH